MKRVALIACSKNKLERKTHAQNVYTGELFKKSLAYAKQEKFHQTFILSAKHHVLPLDTIIAPYDLTLRDMNAQERNLWGRIVLAELAEYAHLDLDEFTFFAGKLYRDPITPFLRHVEIPLEGMGIGEQLGYLKKITS